MKVLYFLFLLAFVGVVGLFAYQNNHSETVNFWDQTREYPFPAIVGVTYVVGMLTGWTVIGLLRRSWRHSVEAVR